MNKSYSSNWILVIGFLSIIILIIVNYNKETINEYIYKQTNKNNYIIANPNQYFIDSDFKFVKNYTDDVNNKEELLNYIYYVINSGETKVNGTCSDEYINCLNDFKEISNNRELLSNLNNYVHPYNSFKYIIFKSNSYGEFIIEIEHTYTEEMINEINLEVDNFIKNNINSTQSTIDKIRVIHDFIINNTDYDENTNDSSKSAYGVFKNKKAVCSGYADAVSIFLNTLGIKNYRVSNDTHIWNLILVNGKWVHLDATWDDPTSNQNIIDYNYFLIDTNKLMSLNDNEHNFDRSVFLEAE